MYCLFLVAYLRYFVGIFISALVVNSQIKKSITLCTYAGPVFYFRVACYALITVEHNSFLVQHRRYHYTWHRRMQKCEQMQRMAIAKEGTVAPFYWPLAKL